MAVIKKHPQEIKKVALAIRNAASAIAPRATGNLRNVLRQYNTPDRMITYKKGGDASILFFTGPPGARYGAWWNDPPALKAKNKNGGKNPRFAIRRNHSEHWNFAKKALNDPTIKASIKEYAKALGVMIATDFKTSVYKMKVK